MAFCCICAQKHEITEFLFLLPLVFACRWEPLQEDKARGQPFCGLSALFFGIMLAFFPSRHTDRLTDRVTSGMWRYPIIFFCWLKSFIAARVRGGVTIVFFIFQRFHRKCLFFSPAGHDQILLHLRLMNASGQSPPSPDGWTWRVKIFFIFSGQRGKQVV